MVCKLLAVRFLTLPLLRLYILGRAHIKCSTEAWAKSCSQRENWLSIHVQHIQNLYECVIHVINLLRDSHYSTSPTSWTKRLPAAAILPVFCHSLRFPVVDLPAAMMILYLFISSTLGTSYGYSPSPGTCCSSIYTQSKQSEIHAMAFICYKPTTKRDRVTIAQRRHQQAYSGFVTPTLK